MGERTSFAPGTFCAVDLGTNDAAAAKPFYTQLFGWEAEDVPPGAGVAYTMLRSGGKVVAGVFERADFPHQAWVSYVSVEDVDETAARVAELGGEVIEGPADITTVGRVAVVRDPTGGAFALWKPRDFAGAELVNEPGAFSLNQLNTTDVEAAKKFYDELFGWRIDQVSTGEQEYWGVYNGDNLNGGMMPMPEEQARAGIPSHWIVYFTSTDLDTSVAKIEKLGGQIMLAPMEISGMANSPDSDPEPSPGRIAIAQDPQGAIFGLFEGRVDP